MTIESVALKTPFVDLLPPLSTAEFEALRLKIELEGFNPHCPILVDEDGNILDGHNRYAIFPDAPTKTLHGLSEAEKQARVITENFARRNLSPEQKRELDKTRKAIARELKKEKWNQEEIARLFGVTRQAVSLWLGEEVITNASTCVSYHPDSRVKIPKDEYAPLSTIQEPKWRVKALLGKLESDRANKTDYFITKFSDKVDEIFSGLPKPKEYGPFTRNDLPLLFTASEVQQFALEHRLNKAQIPKVLLKPLGPGYRNPEVCLGIDFS